MKIKVCDLAGKNLDAAVYLADEWSRESAFVQVERGRCPSRKWEDGGPFIHRERIALRHIDGEPAEACVAPQSDYDTFVPGRASYQTGSTVLEAAMRAFVLSRLGAEVDLP